MKRKKLIQIIVTVTVIVLFFTLSGLFWLATDAQKGSTSSAFEKSRTGESSAEQPHPEGTEPHAAEEGKADEHSEGGEEATGVKLTSEEKHNIGLKTVVVDLRRLDSVIRMAGVVKSDPDREALLSSRVAGRILGVFARVGDTVKKGKKLAEIESVEIQKLQVDLIQAENRRLLTMAELGRIKKLVESKIAPRKELIVAENQHQTVLNEIDGLAQQLVLLGLPQEAVRRVRNEKSISTFALVSPIRGVVAERHVVLGEMVEPAKVIFKILDLSVVLIEGNAFEEALPKLKIGQRVRIRLPAYPGEFFTGKIIRISPIIDPSKRTLRLWAVVPNRTGKLKPNLFAEMDVVVGDGGKVLAVPLEAIIRTEGKSIVLVEEKGSFIRTDLILGAKDDRYIEVKKGLHFGDRVVIDGKQQIYTQSLMEQQGGAALGGHGH